MFYVSSTMYFSEIIRAWNLSTDLKSYCHSLSSNSNETSAQVIEVLPSELEPCIVLCISCIDGFSSHNDATLVNSSEAMLEYLLSRSHDFSESSFDGSDQVRRTSTIVIDHFEFEFLLFLKKISHR